MDAENITFTVTYKGKPHDISRPLDSTVQTLKEHIREITGVEPEYQKLLYKGKLKDEHTLGESNLLPGSKVMLLATSPNQVQKIQELDQNAVSKIPFDRVLPRKVQAYKPVRTSQDDQYTFHRIEVLPQFSQQERARSLLQRLKEDLGVREIMKKYKWSVGALIELSPSERSILGYNRNKGETIAIRLRTDDLEGFRGYDMLLKVLLHELTHMVWSEHDQNFHQLDRKLNKEVVELNWTKSNGKTLSKKKFFDPDDVSYSDANPSTSRVLGGAKSDPSLSQREVMANAAMLRLTAIEKELDEGCGSGGPQK
ncbi:WLM-domain-containing protein [Basidiobolus meristosporus CBS 931.73]|uniref:WLM-domain-containing protein n=1 Tax=Basidiobolus meristosporus CBS 931.73 TaxID=1314790 RepID=A0A1Y1Y3I1_9FUNG|nr:WLM-domain-containing protein [Basidiobolus meristosporus CBS 931.73]|eukprot:ORX92560.1 WLM-domain-containing protein [Basidiobolus meristosporus CBS 931.73]